MSYLLALWLVLLISNMRASYSLCRSGVKLRGYFAWSLLDNWVSCLPEVSVGRSLCLSCCSLLGTSRHTAFICPHWQEWAQGFSQRFGLYFVDFNAAALPRYPKASVAWFSKFLSGQ